MFELRAFLKKGLLEAIGNMPDYKVRLNAVGWLEKEILLESDLAEIDAAIEAQYPTAVEDTESTTEAE